MKARCMRAVCFQTFVLEAALMCVLQFFDFGVVLRHSACLIVIRLDGPGCFLLMARLRQGGQTGLSISLLYSRAFGTFDREDSIGKKQAITTVPTVDDISSDLEFQSPRFKVDAKRSRT